MKILFILLISILIVAPSFSQNSSGDLKQEIAELRNEIKDIEAEIADAKINYPEDVPELEKELATFKKMLSSFEKMAGISSTPQPVLAKTSPPENTVSNSPIVPIILNQPVTAPSYDQATDRLLWYTGKKINDSTLVTTRAMVVQFQPTRNRVVAQPEEKNDSFQKIIAELKKSKQRKDELIDKIANLKNGTLYYPQLVLALKYYNDFDIRYEGVVKNTIDLTDPLVMSKISEGMPSEKKLGGSTVPEMSSDDDLPNIRNVKNVLNEAKTKFDALPDPENFPPPPEHELGICASCDKKIIERESKADSLWAINYLGKEEEILQMILSVYGQAALLGTDVVEKDPDILDINSMLLEVEKRIDKKNSILIKKYGKDLKRQIIVNQTVLGRERQKELLGTTTDNNLLDKIITSSNSTDSVYQKYFEEQIGLKNYNFALNIGAHMGRERQMLILGARKEDDDFFWKNVVLKSIDYNRFALTLDLDFVFERADDEDNLELKATGTISTNDKVYVRLYPDSCSWRMALFGTDFRDADKQRTAIPLKAKSGEKTVRDKDDNLVTYAYSGPEDMVAFLPEFKIDLCDISKKDSAFMMPITYTYDFTPSGQDLKTSYKEDMLAIGNHMFMDINKLEESGNEVIDIATEIMDNVSQSQVTDPTGNPKLDKMQNEYNFKLKQDSYKKKVSNMGMNRKSVFLFNANNGSTVFIDQTNDTKHTIDENTKLVKGQIHLRVVHDPVE
jgi:hypothetical protein